MALIGPSGSGKTFSALRIATGLGGRIALIDTEHGTSRKYADLFGYDILELESFHPSNYVKAVLAATRAGYDTLIIDSLSHAWAGKDGALDLVDQAAKRSKTANTYAAWRDVTALHNELIETILQADLHIIATMRSKTRYVLEQDDKGKTQVRKVGLEAVQRDGLEYEFDIAADMDLDNNLIVTKTRCVALNKKVFREPGEDVATILRDWLGMCPPSQQTRRRPPRSKSAARSDSVAAPPCQLAQETKELFDGHSIDAEGRKDAFKAIREKFKIKKLDEIREQEYDQYWQFVKTSVLPSLGKRPCSEGSSNRNRPLQPAPQVAVT